MSKHYVYKITNIKNGNIYIGKRSHHNPQYDNYMGSGTLIKQAIRKHGLKNFTKEILNIFDSEEEAFKFEKSIVDMDFCQRKDTYNLHEGGYGGWGHINILPKNQRTNIISLIEKRKNGTLIVRKRYSIKGMSETARNNYSIATTNKNRRYWDNITQEDKLQVRKKMSESKIGDKNYQFGSHVYINPITFNEDNFKKRYKEGEQPDGWITIIEWEDSKKLKSRCGEKHHFFGTHTYLNPATFEQDNIKIRYKDGEQPDGWMITSEWRKLKKFT